MRRFNFDDEDPDRDEIERFLNSEESHQYIITPEEYKNIIEEELALYETKLKSGEQKINFKILLLSISLLKKSFWWKFQRLNTKLNNIQKVYLSLIGLINLEIEK